MSDRTPIRKSTRRRVPTRKYSIDAFEGLDTVESYLEGDAQSSPSLLINTDGNPGFINGRAADAPNTMEDNDAFIDVSNGSEVATPVEESDDTSFPYSDVEAIETNDKKFKQVILKNQACRGPRNKKVHNSNVHSRGVLEPHVYQGKGVNIQHIIGTSVDDLLPFLQSRDKWAHNPTLPSRKTDKNGYGGLGYPFAYDIKSREADGNVQWDWYHRHGAGHLMKEKQNSYTLDIGEMERYIPVYDKVCHSFLMGPYGKQQVFELAINHSIFLNQGLDHRSTSVPKTTKGNASQQQTGWIVNLGARIRILDWAPNQDGMLQYLAVTVTNTGKLPDPPTSAFAPSEQSPACVQIWAFATSDISGHEDLFDSNQPPDLAHVICTEWGNVKQLRWCPVTRHHFDETSSCKFSIGLLAGVWSDGYVRVLDVQLDKSRDSSKIYVRYKVAAVELRPPNTICTCMTWLSSTKIAAGCANGFVAIWNIAEQIISSIYPLGNVSEPLNQHLSSYSQYPLLYQLFHHSYILTIASAYPECPHFLATSSMDGHLRLTDSRTPSTDFTHAPRARHGTTNLEYHQNLRAFLAADDNDFIRILPIRRFFSAILVARSPGSPLSITIGKVHSSVLVGSADGSVIATNPMRRIFDHKGPSYQQKWFQHDWTRKGEGMSRFTEGYKVESVQLARTPKNTKKVGESVMHTTIHEQEAGITQVTWNPNLRCGGWAAAGMGSGLLRVENLAI